VKSIPKQCFHRTICAADIVAKNMDDLVHFKTIDEISREFRSGNYTPSEVVTHFLSRIDKYDDDLKSYATVMSESAIELARIATTEIGEGKFRGPLLTNGLVLHQADQGLQPQRDSASHL
jgi:hypothetical protein